MANRPLDLDAVQAFVYVAELSNFTRAAEIMETTQSAVSLKLKRLEERLGCKLVERTPRYVQVSTQGSVFLEHARNLLRAHDEACASFNGTRHRLTVGISDHVAGPELPSLVAGMVKRDPQLQIEVRIGTSDVLLRNFDRRELDAVIVRLDKGRDDGEVIIEEKFGWFASQTWKYRSDEPLPLATMPEPCGVRSTATKLLDEAHLPWTEVFVGGGVSSVSAAVMAGLGISALTRRVLPLGAVEIGSRLGLPELPQLPMMLHTRVNDDHRRETLNKLCAAFKNAAYV